MFYNHLIFSMVTLSLRIVLKYCVLLDETEQLIIPEKLGSGENRGDFDYPAEKARYLWFTSRKDNAGCGRVYCGVYRCRCMSH